MIAHIRGEVTDPTIVGRAMDDKLSEPTNTDLYRKRQHNIEPVFGDIKATLAMAASHAGESQRCRASGA
jgi:hypothetical protein